MRITELQLRELIREEILREAEESAEQGEPGLTKSIMKGVTKGGTRFAAKKGLKAGFEFAVKSVPGFGSVAAFGDFVATFGLLIKDMKDFTDDLLKVSQVKLTGVSSILGEYSIFKADPEDIRKISASLRKNMTEEQRQDLLVHWGDILDGLKELIIDFLLAIKDFTAEAAIPVAFVIKILPVETVIKDILFYTSRLLERNIKALEAFEKAAIAGTNKPSLVAVLMVLIDFLTNQDAISAFAELDEVINQEIDPGRSRGLSAAGRIAQKGTEVYKYVDDIGQQIAKELGDLNI